MTEIAEETITKEEPTTTTATTSLTILPRDQNGKEKNIVSQANSNEIATPLAISPYTLWNFGFENNYTSGCLVDGTKISPSRPASCPSQGVNAIEEFLIAPPLVLNEGEQSWASGSSSPQRSCQNCHTTQTPFWRRFNGGFYCNACGLYFKTHRRMRPVSLQLNRNTKRARTRADVCINCNARETPLWRRVASGDTVCNACGLYYKLHGTHRPVSFNKGINRGFQIKQRDLLPKSGESWHQYHPAFHLHNDNLQVMNFHQQQVRAHQSSFHLGGTIPPISPLQVNQLHRDEFNGFTTSNLLAQSTSFDGFTGTTLFLPNLFIHPVIPTFLPGGTSGYLNLPGGEAATNGASTGTNPNDGSLDDSMRWFSSTCLDIPFSNPNSN